MLYANVATKELAAGIRAYAPAVPLWSDNASKGRWISLPPGTTIDRSDPTEWIFPVGTKVWKEFSRDGIRVETRLFQKVQAGFWVRATYAWNADDTDATRRAPRHPRWDRAATPERGSRPARNNSAATEPCDAFRASACHDEAHGQQTYPKRWRSFGSTSSP